MTREEVYRQIEEYLGFVPSWFKALPEEALEGEWRIHYQTELQPVPIPAKYWALIGLSAAAAFRSKSGIIVNTELARTFGASDVEIRLALHRAKTVVGWTAFLEGAQIDYGHFREQVLDV